MPVEVIDEFEVWRKVKDYQGDIGWIHLSQLSRKRTLLTTKDGIVQTELGKLLQEPKLLAKGDGYLSPVLDATGYSWIIPKSGNRQILVFSPEGKRVPFSSGWLGNLDRRSFSMSNEGGRIVVSAGTKENSGVYVASVIRDRQGNPIGFGSGEVGSGGIKEGGPANRIYYRCR